MAPAAPAISVGRREHSGVDRGSVARARDRGRRERWRGRRARHALRRVGEEDQGGAWRGDMYRACVCSGVAWYSLYIFVAAPTAVRVVVAS